VPVGVGRGSTGSLSGAARRGAPTAPGPGGRSSSSAGVFFCPGRGTGRIKHRGLSSSGQRPPEGVAQTASVRSVLGLSSDRGSEDSAGDGTRAEPTRDAGRPPAQGRRDVLGQGRGGDPRRGRGGCATLKARTGTVGPCAPVMGVLGVIVQVSGLRESSRVRLLPGVPAREGARRGANPDDRRLDPD
jgi:hypothetical protein